LTHHVVVRRSLDARKGTPVYRLRVRVSIDEPFRPEPAPPLALRDVRGAPPAVVVGAGPAGLFAALTLIEHGLRPIVLERGADVRGRRHAVARIARAGIVDPDNNYCFGEGGAGTFSDGKLYTRATKRGSIPGVLDVLVRHGAPRGRPRDRALDPRRARAAPALRPRSRGEALRGRCPRRATPGADRPDPVSRHDSTVRVAGGLIRPGPPRRRARGVLLLHVPG